MRSAGFRFIGPSLPVSPARAVTLGAELVDSIGLRYGVSEASVEPGWWRRLCRFTSFVRCSGGEMGEGLRVVVVVDSRPRRPGAGFDADLVYELDSRRGSVILLGRRGASIGLG